MVVEDDVIRILEDALISLDEVIVSLIHAVRNNAGDFRYSVAPLTGEISLLLRAECEEYGMTKELYQNVMKYSRKFPQKFKAIIEIGNFKFEGENYDTNRRIVLSIGGIERSQSNIPPSFLPARDLVESGKKNKVVPRGSVCDNFKSAKCCLASSQQI